MVLCTFGTIRAKPTPVTAQSERLSADTDEVVQKLAAMTAHRMQPTAITQTLSKRCPALQQQEAYRSSFCK